MKNPIKNFRTSRFINADENDPHYPIRGLSDLLSLRELCREKTRSIGKEVESTNGGDHDDSSSKFNRQNKLKSLRTELGKFEKVLELIEIDIENILSGIIKMI